MTQAIFNKKSELSDDWKRRCIDALTVTTFFTVLGGLNEFFIAGLRADQVLMTRLMAIPLLLVSGAAYGIYRDVILRLTRFDKRGERWRTVIDTCTCLSFRVPLYGAILLLGGARGQQLSFGLLGATIIILFSGRPCGWCIDRMRIFCDLSPFRSTHQHPTPRVHTLPHPRGPAHRRNVRSDPIR